MTLALDHLLYAGPDLALLSRQLKRLSGEVPQPGGRHVGLGTHNALLGLGGSDYLELIGPDAGQDGGAMAGSIADLRSNELHAWCVRTGDPDALQAAIEATGHGVRRVAMSRAAPDGTELRWELLFAERHDWAGAAPFFIHWGDTPHPAAALKGELRLRHLAILQADPEPLQAWLSQVGLTTGIDERVSVAGAPGRGLRADLVGRRGPFVLRGGAGGMTV